MVEINYDLLPSEVRERNMLEGIFMPEARSLREELFNELVKPDGSLDNPKFAHYTTAANALKIIESKRIWLRSTALMSDYSEVEYGFRLLHKWFGEKSNCDRFYGAFDQIYQDVAKEAVEYFNNHWRGGLNLKTYVACISVHAKSEDRDGRLSMWRAFGSSDTSVAIVLQPPAYSGAIEKTSAIFSPVAYMDYDGVSSVFSKVILKVNENIEILKCLSRDMIKNWISHALVSGVVSVKHTGFKEEKEWRLISVPELWGQNLLGIETHIIRGIPQRIVTFPIDAGVDPALHQLDIRSMLSHVIIGPTPFPLSVREAMIDLLRSAGISNPEKKVLYSEIPLRV